MRRRHLFIATLLVPAVLLTLRLLAGRSGSATPPTARSAGRQLVPRIRYRVRYTQAITGAGPAARETLVAEGVWTTIPRGPGRIEARFSPTKLDGPAGQLPDAADASQPLQLVSHDGVLT